MSRKSRLTSYLFSDGKLFQIQAEMTRRKVELVIMITIKINIFSFVTSINSSAIKEWGKRKDCFFYLKQ